MCVCVPSANGNQISPSVEPAEEEQEIHHVRWGTSSQSHADVIKEKKNFNKEITYFAALDSAPAKGRRDEEPSPDDFNGGN